METALASESRGSLNAYTLKMIAVATMLIDHIGAVFFPDLIVFRMVGRLAAPIFAFLIAEGYRQTGDVSKYLRRLLLFAVISMVPYELIFGKYFNILFDFAIGLIVLILTDKVSREWQKWAIVFAGAGLAYVLETDGMLGMCILVYLFHRYRDKPKKVFVSMAVLYLAATVALIVDAFVRDDLARLTGLWLWIRLLALLALPFLFAYNGQRGRKSKYLFYWFYPVHLLVLYLIYILI